MARRSRLSGATVVAFPPTTAHPKTEPPPLFIAFAAETEHVVYNAKAKLARKGCAWIVANDVSQPGVGMDADDNRVILFSRAGERVTFGPAPKIEVARFLLAKISRS